MLRQRLLTIALVSWLILVFNIERYDLLNINIPTIIYVISAAVLVGVLLLPDFVLIRWYVLLIPVLLLYGGYRYVTMEPDQSEFAFLTIGVESSIIGITFLLGWLISKQVADTERTYDALVMNSENSRTLSPLEGEDVFNRELFRARQYERPMTILLVKPPSLSDLRKVYPGHLSYQVSLQHRYLKARIAQLSEALLYATDPVTTYGDNVVICLPETTGANAMNLARRIAAVVKASLGVQLQIGIAELSKEAPLYRDMLALAEKNIYAFVSQVTDDSDKNDDQDAAPPTIKFEDDDTLPIPVLFEDTIDGMVSIVDKRAEDAKQANTIKDQVIVPFAKPIPQADQTGTQKPPSFYDRIVARLLGMQLFPLEQLQIHSDDVVKVYYNPDFWVNRLPYQSTATRNIYRYVKRLLDMTLILLASPFLLIIFSVIGCAIYFEDRGPIFYAQNRTGRGNHTFKMWKFRSMIVDANDPQKLKELGVYRNHRGETVDKNGEKLKNDPRITRVGKLLRKTSLDELPQLWNIWVGDMSLVGPRPTSFGVETYEMSQTHRLSVKPGLTGLWQVYDRGDTDFDNRLVWDMRYIDKMCLWLDLQILFLTFTRQVLKQRGA